MAGWAAPWGGLNWEARQKASVDGRVNHARSQVRALAAQAEEMSRYLASKAQVFEEADRQGASEVGQVGGLFRQWQSTQSWWHFPSHQVNAWWNLGGVFGGPSRINAVPLPVVGGAAVIGLASLGPLSGAFSTAQDFGESLWNWLHGYGWMANADLVAPGQGGAAYEPAKGGFGALLDRPSESTTKPQSETGTSPETAPQTHPAAMPESGAETAPVEESWWLDVPRRNQQGLKYGKQETAYGCVPTTTSMILSYWHAKDPANKTKSAQELLNINVQEREFKSTGMSPSKILDEVRDLEYGVVEEHPNADGEALKAAVAKGPVLAIVKLGLKATGANHAVVVTGISDDGRQVRINDPWDGQPYTYSWEAFSRSWGADFGKDAPKSNFVVIRPS